MYIQIIFKRCLKNCVDPFLFSLQKYLVHDSEEVWSKLKISYDHLDKQHQDMFLDIACFLGGLKISTICRVWSGDY